ncbi:MAG: hypothetical protein MZV65_47850 [Chromatiales bacterium]|nr:hypothetical protein [Chromatiales bacterium]
MNKLYSLAASQSPSFSQNATSHLPQALHQANCAADHRRQLLEYLLSDKHRDLLQPPGHLRQVPEDVLDLVPDLEGGSLLPTP